MKWSRLQTRTSLNVAVRLMGARHTEWIGIDKSPCRKLSRGIQSIDNLARDWHTLIAGIFWAYRSYPLIADQQSLRLIQ